MRYSKSIWALILALVSFTQAGIAQNASGIPRVVPTIADLLALDPRLLATRTVGTNTTFLATVFTTGDTNAGAGPVRMWQWTAASTAATNTIANLGPFAYPTNAAAGRWIIATPGTWADGDKGPLTVSGGGNTFVMNARSISWPELPIASAGSLIGRSDGLGSGNLGLITEGTGVSITNGVIQIDPEVMASINTGWASVDSMADLVTAIADPNHADVFHVKSYWKDNRDVGGGIWFYQLTDYPANNAVRQSARGGKMYPRFLHNIVDITRFGASSMYAPAITDPAVQQALAMQQDRTVGGILWGPDGYFRILNTIRRKSVGTGTKYVVNNAGGYPIGATNIVLGTGSGTILERDTVTFNEVPEMSVDYRVVSFNTTNNTLRIAYPGLLAAISDGQAMSIRPRPRLLMAGVGHGVVQLAGIRSHGATTYVMETDNIPIIELGGYHNIVEMMSLQYDNFQTSEKTMAACIYNPPEEELFQNRIYGVSMIRPAYGIHVAPTGGFAKSAPNNFVNEILVESASVSTIAWDKSGTMNQGSGWYLQNMGPTTNGISETQTFTNLTKSGSTITLHFPGNLPSQLHEGMFVEVANAGAFSGQFSALTVTNGTVIYDVTATAATNSITSTNGTASTVNKSQMSGPMFKNIAQWALNGIDIEATIGPPSASIPIAIDNVGGLLAFDGLHDEYLTWRTTGQAAIRNRGGTITIKNYSLINSGRSNNVVGFIFENDTLDGTTNTARGVIRVDVLSTRDLSVNPGGSGAFIASTNKNGAPPVWVGTPHKPANLRMNVTNLLLSGTTVTSVTTNLVFP